MIKEELQDYIKWCDEHKLNFKNLDNLSIYNHRMIIIEEYPYLIYGSHLRAGYYRCKCPNCNTEYKCKYYYDFDKKEYKHDIKYCPECGQKIISLKKDL